MPKLTDAITYIQFIVYLGVLILSIGICYATMTNKIESLESQVPTIRSSHESVILLNDRFERIQKDTSEIKSDIKDIKASLNKR